MLINKINIVPNAVPFSSIGPRETFMWNGDYFIKIKPSPFIEFKIKQASAMWLTRNPGSLCYFEDSDVVTQVDITMT